MTMTIRHWWRALSRDRRRTVLGRATASLGAFGLFAAGLPAVSDLNAERLDDQRFRINSERLASTNDAGHVMRTDPFSPELLQHSWLRSVEYSFARDPVSAVSPLAAMERDQAALDGLRRFDRLHTARAEDMSQQTQCLAEAVYYEARSESLFGQISVAEVIYNRVRDHRFPDTICDVVYQGSTRTTGCQFTFTCDGALNREPRGWRWEQAQTVASHVLLELNEPLTAGATHYHATYVDPVWNSGLIRTKKIGRHIFYRFPRGAEWSFAKARQRDRLARRRAGLASLTSSAPADEVSVIRLPSEAMHGDETTPSVISSIPTERPASERAEDDDAIQISAFEPNASAAPVT